MEEKARLDRFLADAMPSHSRSRIEKLIESDGVLVDGERVTKRGFPLKPGMVVAAEEPEETPPHDLTPVPMDLAVLYEDDVLLVVDKPQGLAVHPAPGLGGAPTLVHGLLARGHGLSQEGGSFRPGIVHRLDKDTTGLMLVAKTDFAHRSLAGQIQSRTAGRRYFAVAKGDLSQEKLVVKAPIGAHPSNPLLRAVRQDGKEAVTHLKKVQRLDQGVLLACRLETGRTHQIRVHLAALGLPVLGDPLYAPGKWSEGPLQLHSAWIRFEHPATGETVILFSPPPQDFLGREFALRGTMDEWTE